MRCTERGANITNIHLILLGFAFVVWAIISLVIVASYLTTPFLREAKGKKPNSYPKLSIIVPAKDEEINIGACLKSLLAQDYPNFELIVADDRSNDRTAQIAKSYCEIDQRVKLVQIKDLPAGWTGKTRS